MNLASQKLTTAPRLWWFALGLGIALVVAAATALWQLRSDTIDSQAREIALLSLALTDALDRGLRGAEEGLHAMRLELSEGRLPVTDDGTARALRTRAELMPLVRTIWLVNREGRLLSASDTTPVPELPSFAPALDRLTDDATAVSRPFMDVSAHESLVALAVRVADAPGIAGGWIVAALPAEALRGAFPVAIPAADARLAVFRSDGVRLAGAVTAGPTLDEASRAQRLANMPNMELRRFSDGSERLVGLHSLPHFGVKLMLTRNLDAVLAPWRQSARLTAMGLTLLLAIMAVSIHIVQRADRRRLEAQRALEVELARASKLESLGTLAGGVAHDFNNVLAAIVGFGEMAQDSAPPGSEQAHQLEKMLQAALRGKALVERILAFSRGGARASTVFELEPVVEEVLTLLSASLPPGVVLERRLAAHGARLRGDPTQVFEAIMNLCTNAMQAMSGGGRVSVQLERLHVGGPRVLSHSQLSAGDYLALAVSDQGTGITPAVMERLFEPFFTTRSAQSGTGLGLAVVHGVVAEFGGATDVQSTPGQGARFTLYFPECTEALDSQSSFPQAAPAGTGQTLLVVDDEPMLLDMVAEMLKGLGYEPVVYSDPVTALQALRETPQRFAAVVADEVMPGLSGTQLTKALRLHMPHLPVLLVSGYGGALLASRAAAAGVTRVLAKPLQRAELARALAELLH
jgi:signal transduction histidine kinase/CheY-like chemotaxis protein